MLQQEWAREEQKQKDTKKWTGSLGLGGVEDVGYRGSCSRSVKPQQTHMHKTRYIGTNIQKVHQTRD